MKPGTVDGPFMKISCPFVLASRSPRRHRLLEQIDLSFIVEPSATDETVPDGASPESVVQQLAVEKAQAVAARFPDALTLGADTIVVLENEILGKPRDEKEAHQMLRRLSGRTHTVFTGIALLHPPSGRQVTAYEQTAVTFAGLTDAEIAAYVATGSPMDKAGAYGIQDDQGALFISRIDGDYYNVVGLPLHRLYRVMKDSFADLLAAP